MSRNALILDHCKLKIYEDTDQLGPPFFKSVCRETRSQVCPETQTTEAVAKPFEAIEIEPIEQRVCSESCFLLPQNAEGC